jgi:hypothetical protein
VVNVITTAAIIACLALGVVNLWLWRRAAVQNHCLLHNVWWGVQGIQRDTQALLSEAPVKHRDIAA